MADISTDSLGDYYDTVPYESHPFPQTAPEHLEAVAYLFGLDAPAVASARVLELGCAAGGNLIPIAARHPKANVVGVDLSPMQVAQGVERVRSLGLSKQVDLRAFNIAEIDDSFGEFDYIICHGVYSWVPPEVQDAILRVCSQHLAPNGIAYISYNTYPGWKAKEIVRDAMVLRGGPRDDPREKLSYALGMLEFLEGSARPDSVLKKALDENLPLVRTASPWYLLHEFLEPCNLPCYFKEFIARAEGHGLAYLAEAEPQTMFVANYSAKVQDPLLRECGGNQLVMEQYLDFLTNRAFRQTLLVKQERAAQIRYQLDNERLRNLAYASVFRMNEGAPITLDAHPQSGVALTSLKITLSSPLHKAAAQVLDERYPSTVPFDALVKEVCKRIDASPESVELPILQMLEELLIQNGLRIRRTPIQAPQELPSSPRTLKSVRSEPGLPMDKGERAGVTNLWHEFTILTPLERTLLPMLDGKTSQDKLVKHVAAEIAAGRLAFDKENHAKMNKKDQSAFIREQAVIALKGLQRRGLLVAA